MVLPLEILPYDPRWAVEFQAERAGIACALRRIALPIEHSGSTAVPGLVAKPVVDIQVSVEHLQPIRAYAEPLALCGKEWTRTVQITGGEIQLRAELP